MTDEGQWAVWECDDGTFQVIPTFGREHIRSIECWCNPHWDSVAKNLLIHECDN